MPTVRYTADGGHFRVAGVGFGPGDTRDVDAELADYLTDRDDFELLEEPDDDIGEEDGSPDAASTGDDVDDDDTDGFDVDAFLDRNVDPIADDIRAGEVDDHLDAIGEAADRVTVQDAVGERRADLEG